MGAAVVPLVSTLFGTAASLVAANNTSSNAPKMTTPDPIARNDEAIKTKREAEKRDALRRGLASTIKNKKAVGTEVYKPELGGIGNAALGQKKKLLGQ